LLLVVILALLSIFQLTTEDAEALPGHAMSVSLFPAQLDAKVTESQDGAVTFGGNLTIEKPQGIERVTVTLTADCTWPVVVSPQTIPFINPGTQRFQLTVIVPGGTPVSSATVTVYARAESPIWDDDQSASARVNVQQYFKMDIWSNVALYKTEPGQTVIGKMFVNNSGNGEDTFAISTEEPPNGLSNVLFREGQVSVPRGYVGEFTFSLIVSEDLDPGMDGVMLTVIFRVESLKVSETGQLYVKTFPIYLYFQGLEEQLKENWPTYVGYGVVAPLMIVPVAFLYRRRKRKKEPLPELDAVEV